MRACDSLLKGFWRDLTPRPYDPHQPYPSIRDNPVTTFEHLWPDLLEARLFIFTAKSEMYTDHLMETRLSSVDQKGEIRYIFPPRLGVNERADSKRHPLLTLPTIPALLRRILYWESRYPGIPVLLSKRDVMPSFKLIPPSIDMLYRDGFRIGHVVLMYLSLYFGWKGAPGTWGVVSTLMQQYIANRNPDNPNSNGAESFEASQFVDDGGFAEPELGIRPWISA